MGSRCDAKKICLTGNSFLSKAFSLKECRMLRGGHSQLGRVPLLAFLMALTCLMLLFALHAGAHTCNEEKQKTAFRLIWMFEAESYSEELGQNRLELDGLEAWNHSPPDSLIYRPAAYSGSSPYQQIFLFIYCFLL
jgi:hypothetical protein